MWEGAHINQCLSVYCISENAIFTQVAKQENFWCKKRGASRERTQLSPLSHLQISMQETQPFAVTSQQGLIRRCVGCDSEFSDKTKSPSHDLILKKQDFRQYPKNGMWFRSNSLSNTYYHLSLECIRSKFSHTEHKHILLYDEVRKSLTPLHIALLYRFGLHNACTHE